MSLHFKTIGLWSAHTSPHASSSSKAWSLLPLALALPVAFIPYIMLMRRYKGWVFCLGFVRAGSLGLEVLQNVSGLKCFFFFKGLG